jgi:hypothetical protein
MARAVQAGAMATAAFACCTAIASGHGGSAPDQIGDVPSGQPDIQTIRYGHYDKMCFVPIVAPDDSGHRVIPTDTRTELFLDTGSRRGGAEFVVTKRGMGPSQLRRLPGRQKVGRPIHGGDGAICARRKSVGVPDSSSSTDPFRWKLRFLSADGQVGDRVPDHGFCKHDAQSADCLPER